MENNYTKEGYTQIIKRIETQMINVKSRRMELELELRALDEWQAHQEKARRKWINEAQLKGIELDPKDFLMEL